MAFLLSIQIILIIQNYAVLIMPQIIQKNIKMDHIVGCMKSKTDNY